MEIFIPRILEVAKTTNKKINFFPEFGKYCLGITRNELIIDNNNGFRILSINYDGSVSTYGVSKDITDKIINNHIMNKIFIRLNYYSPTKCLYSNLELKIKELIDEFIKYYKSIDNEEDVRKHVFGISRKTFVATITKNNSLCIRYLNKNKEWQKIIFNKKYISMPKILKNHQVILQRILKSAIIHRLYYS